MKKENPEIPTTHPAESEQKYYGDQEEMNREMKVVSFITHVDKTTDGTPQKINYPELDNMLNTGYEIWDVLPSWGNSDNYFVTFVLRKRERKKPRRRLGFFAEEPK